MLIEIFIALVAFSLCISGSLTFWPVKYWYDFYIPLVLFIAGYLVGLFIAWWLLAFFGLFVNQKKEYSKPSKWSRFWMMQGLWYINHHANIDCQFKGLNKIPRNQKFLLVCNHRSRFDSMLITEKLGKKDIAFISKKSNFKIPLGHKFMWGMCYIPIDRDDPLNSLQGMRRGMDLIKRGASSIGLFPEGTRCTTDVLGQFHEGGFNIAIKSNCPIAVMTCKGTENIVHNFPFKRTKVLIEVIKVIYPDEFENLPAKKVSENVRTLMYNNLSQ